MYDWLYEGVSEANTVENVMPFRMCGYFCDKSHLFLKLNMTFQEVPKSFEFLRLKKQKECEQKEAEPEETRIKNNNNTL